MTKAAQTAKKLRSVLRKIGKTTPPDLPGADDAVGVLVMSFLMWESTTDKAVTAFERIDEHVVDYNDLRVCMPHEVVEIIGERYPLALERANRLRATLRDVYMREHAVSLDRLHSQGKRDVKKYVESLDGIVPYVAARVMLLCFDAHAIPVDEQLRSQLAESEAADPDLDVAELGSWLSRQIKASAGAQAHADLQAWVDAACRKAAARTRRKAAASKASSSRTSRKKKSTAGARSSSGRAPAKTRRKTAGRRGAGRS